LITSSPSQALLNHDLALRTEELEKINSLDKKITAELKSQKDKISSMKVEMSQFKTEDELRKEVPRSFLYSFDNDAAAAVDYLIYFSMTVLFCHFIS
jgi:hypothetical protein